MKDRKLGKAKESISDILEIPKDIVMDLPRITLLGNIQISIENHKGIIEYTSERIRVNIKDGIFIVLGSNLLIKNILNEEIMIRGKIKSTEFDIRGV